MNAKIAVMNMQKFSTSTTIISFARTVELRLVTTMISNEERREVARKLRWPKDSLLAYPDEELIRLRSVIGCRYKQDLYERLADLIDPQDTDDGPEV